MLLFLLLFLPAFCAAQTITPDFGALPATNTVQAHTQSIAIGDRYAVFNFFNDLDIERSIIILNENGLIEETISTTANNRDLDPMIYSDGSTFHAIGFETATPIAFDSLSLIDRNFMIRQYSTTGELLEEVAELVAPTETGFRSALQSIGVNANIVYTQPYSWAGAVSPDWAVQVHENIRINITPEGQVEILPGRQNSVSIYDRQQQILHRRLSDDEFRTVADVAIIDDNIWLYAISGETEETLTSIHALSNTGEVTSASLQTGAYLTRGLIHYAEVMDDELIEAIGLVEGFLDESIRATSVQVLDKNRNVLRTNELIDDAAPFGEASLTAGIDDHFFLATVDVINRNPLRITLHKIDLTSLEPSWSLPLDLSTFGLYQSLVPLPDGGAIVFGSEPIINSNEFLCRVTRIAGDGTTTTQQAYLDLQAWITGANPTYGLLQLAPEAQPWIGKLNVLCYDLSGRLLTHSPVTSTNIQLSGLPAGSYIVQLVDDAGRIRASRRIQLLR